MSLTDESPAAAPHARTRFWRTPDFRNLAILWAVFTLFGVIFALTVPKALMGAAASDTAEAIQRTFIMFSVASAPVAALVWALVVYSLMRWRRRGEWTPEDPDGPPLRRNGWTTGAWIFGSSALCLFLLIWGLAALSAVDAPASAANPLEVDVTGQQWVWTFSYPQQGNAESDQLYLPVNRPVIFKVTSDDVIHSFWVPEMGIKIDANPGMTTSVQTTPDREGLYHVRCAELCGLLHADMETNVHVVSDQVFASWLQAQGGNS